MSERKEYPNSGAIFANTNKQQDNHADYGGSCLVDGVEYWINGWKKKGRNGTFLSLSFRPKNQQGGQTSGGVSSDDDDPF